MPTRLAVINKALVRLGQERIASTSEESEPARVAAEVFDDVCRAELARNAWVFATARASITAESTAPAWGYAKAFNLPSDFIRLIQVGEYFDYQVIRDVSVGAEAPYRIEGSQILTSLGSPLRIRYVKDVAAAPEGWHPAFAESMAWRLAMEMSESLVKSSTKFDMLRREYSLALKDAKRINAIQAAPEFIPDDSFMISRRLD